MNRSALLHNLHKLSIVVVSIVLASQNVVAAAATDPAFNSTTNRYRAINNIPYTSDGTCAITQDTSALALNQASSTPTLTPAGGGAATPATSTTAGNTGATTTSDGSVTPSVSKNPTISSADGTPTAVSYYGGDHFGPEWKIDNISQGYLIRVAKTLTEAGLHAKLRPSIATADIGRLTALNKSQEQDTSISDDNGFGLSKPLNGTTSFATLSTGTLTHLRPLTKLQITYEKKVGGGYEKRTIIAEKRDVGGGGDSVGGYRKSIDLWWQAARLIGFTNGGDVMYYKQVPSNTPITPIGSITGASGSTGCSNAEDTGQSAECTATKPIWGAGSNPRKGQMPINIKQAVFGGKMNKVPLKEVDFMGKSVQVNAKIAGCLVAVLNEIKSKNVDYKIVEMGCYRTDNSPMFYHGYGAACDINPKTNGCSGSARSSCAQSVGGAGKHDIPRSIIDAFNHHGWSWGGDWSDPKDYMHFEFNGYDGQSGGTSP